MINTLWWSMDKLACRYKNVCRTSQWRAVEAKGEANRRLNLWDIDAPTIFEAHIYGHQPNNNGYIVAFRKLIQKLAKLIKATIPVSNIPGNLLMKTAIIRCFPLMYWQKVINTTEIMPAELKDPYPVRRREILKCRSWLHLHCKKRNMICTIGLSFPVRTRENPKYKQGPGHILRPD